MKETSDRDQARRYAEFRRQVRRLPQGLAALSGRERSAWLYQRGWRRQGTAWRSPRAADPTCYSLGTALRQALWLDRQAQGLPALRYTNLPLPWPYRKGTSER